MLDLCIFKNIKNLFGWKQCAKINIENNQKDQNMCVCVRADIIIHELENKHKQFDRGENHKNGHRKTENKQFRF